MTRITQLEDRGAAVAWSPIASYADYVALGAKVCFLMDDWGIMEFLQLFPAAKNLHCNALVDGSEGVLCSVLGLNSSRST